MAKLQGILTGGLFLRIHKLPIVRIAAAHSVSVHQIFIGKTQCLSENIHRTGRRSDECKTAII